VQLLEAKVGGGAGESAPGSLEAAVRSVFAQLTEAPTNWHQGTVYFATSTEQQDKHMKARAPLLLFGGTLMVLLQCMTTAGLFFGSISSSCENNDQCPPSQFCWRGASHRCEYCSFGMLTMEVLGDGGTLNDPMNEHFVGFNTTTLTTVCSDPVDIPRFNSRGMAVVLPRAGVAAWCEQCVNAIDKTVIMANGNTHMAANVASMGYFDWIALCFATFVVAFKVVGELKDILLCEIATGRVGDRLSTRWRLAFLLIGGTRRWLFLPTLVLTVPILVVTKGGDALSVCFNTVAVLFLCEIDNIAYVMGLSERVRARVEHMGRAELADVEAAALVRTKTVHVGLIVAAVVVAVWVGGTGGPNVYQGNVKKMLMWKFMALCTLPFAPFTIGGAAEAFAPGASNLQTAARVGKALGASMLGFVAFGFLVVASNPPEDSNNQ
jgi:hypothetical protein